MTMIIGKHNNELEMNWLDCNNNIKGSTQKVTASTDRGIIANEYSIVCNPDILPDSPKLSFTWLTWPWKETVVVLDTGRRRPINDSVFAFQRNLWVTGRASGERAGSNPPRIASLEKQKPSKT